MHIIGAGGHAKVVIDILLSNKLTTIEVWDENLAAKSPLGFPIQGNLLNFKKLNSDQVIVAIGNNKVRKKVASDLKTTANCIHFTSAISPSASIGIGTVIMANASVNADATVGDHVIINTNASVDHDCIIGDFVHISPQAGLAGNV
ncbi:MAG: acetyltransferase, partial [Bacteroidia bacterium]